MYTKTILAIAITVITACSMQAQQHGEVVKNVDPTSFNQLISSGKGIILDVRTPEEVAGGTIPNASIINFYDEDFVDKINLMNKDKEIYVYCRSGGRSAKAADLLLKNGFKNVYNLDGGITAWQSAGLPVTPSSLSEDPNIKQMTLADFNALLKTDLPVLVDFHTQWCAPCRQMAPIVDQLEKDFAGKAVVLRVDIDKSKEVGKAYDVKGVPVFMLFKNGISTWKHTGIISEEELRKKLN